MLVEFFKLGLYKNAETVTFQTFYFTQCIAVRCAVGLYLSLIGEPVGADDAFVVQDWSLWVTGFVSVPEVNKVETKPLRESFVPLEAVQERPGSVPLHVHPSFNGWTQTYIYTHVHTYTHMYKHLHTCQNLQSQYMRQLSTCRVCTQEY